MLIRFLLAAWIWPKATAFSLQREPEGRRGFCPFARNFLSSDYKKIGISHTNATWFRTDFEAGPTSLQLEVCKRLPGICRQDCCTTFASLECQRICIHVWTWLCFPLSPRLPGNWSFSLGCVSFRSHWDDLQAVKVECRTSNTWDWTTFRNDTDSVLLSLRKCMCCPKKTPPKKTIAENTIWQGRGSKPFSRSHEVLHLLGRNFTSPNLDLCKMLGKVTNIFSQMVGLDGGESHGST